MKRWQKVALLVVLGSSTAVALAGFGGGGMHCGRGKWSDADVQKHTTMFTEHLLGDINATDAQRTQIMALKTNLVQSGLELRGERKEMHQEMMEIWKSPNPDAAKVHAAVDARVEEMKAFAHEAADAALELHKTLTPEQRQALAEKAEKHWN